MSDATASGHNPTTSATFDDHGNWKAPHTFRELVEDTERVARQLVETIDREQALLIPADLLAFLARRVERLATLTREALPWEVE